MDKIARGAMKAIRASVAYLGFTATLFAGISLLIQHNWIDAGLLYLAELIGPFNEVLENARYIAAQWSELIVQPVAQALIKYLSVAPPLWLVEVATLTLFATGPVVRTVWTRRAFFDEVASRRSKYTQLCQLIDERDKEIVGLRQSRDDLQKALSEKNTKRAKSIGGMLGSLTLMGLSVFSGSAPTMGHQARGVQTSFNALKQSFSGWADVETQISKLSELVDIGVSDIEALKARASKLESGENGLLRRLRAIDEQDVGDAISAHVSDKMRMSIFLTRASLAVVASVIFSYVIDWFFVTGV